MGPDGDVGMLAERIGSQKKAGHGWVRVDSWSQEKRVALMLAICK